MNIILIFSQWLFRYWIYACINFDFPDRRIPVIILMSGVPFKPIILSKYFFLIIVFTFQPHFQKINFFVFLKSFSTFIIPSCSNICKKPLSKMQFFYIFESGFWFEFLTFSNILSTPAYRLPKSHGFFPHDGNIS